MKAMSTLFGVLALFTLVPSALSLIFRIYGYRWMPVMSLRDSAIGIAHGLIFVALSQWLLRRSKDTAS
jgi:hypothetical protein